MDTSMIVQNHHLWQAIWLKILSSLAPSGLTYLSPHRRRPRFCESDGHEIDRSH